LLGAGAGAERRRAKPVGPAREVSTVSCGSRGGRSSNNARVHLEGPRWKVFGHPEMCNVTVCCCVQSHRLDGLFSLLCDDSFGLGWALGPALLPFCLAFCSAGLWPLLTGSPCSASDYEFCSKRFHGFCLSLAHRIHILGQQLSAESLRGQAQLLTGACQCHVLGDWLEELLKGSVMTACPVISLTADSR
jgi:hypothetical protein